MWLKKTKGLEKLHNETLHNLYSSLDIVSFVKSRRKRHKGVREGRNELDIAEILRETVNWTQPLRISSSGRNLRT
jgi:hypothetical protein